MDIFGMGFQLMSFKNSSIPSMQNFFNANVATHFQQPGMQPPPIQQQFSGIDPNSIVPGLGLGAANIPTPPSPGDYMQLTQLQVKHQGEQEQYLQGLHNDTEKLKNQVFEKNHYEFGEKGEVVLDEKTGKPKLFEGAEKPEGKSQRLDWEAKVSNALEKKHQTELAELRNNIDKTMKDIQNNPMDFVDPEKAKVRQQQLLDMQKAEKELLTGQKKEFLQATAGHLPNVNEEGKTIGDFVDKGFEDYNTMTMQHELIEMTSPGGQAVMNYFNSVNSFISNQRSYLSQFRSDNDMFDPDKMKNYVNRMDLRPKGEARRVDQA